MDLPSEWSPSVSFPDPTPLSSQQSSMDLPYVWSASEWSASEWSASVSLPDSTPLSSQQSSMDLPYVWSPSHSFSDPTPTYRMPAPTRHHCSLESVLYSAHPPSLSAYYQLNTDISAALEHAFNGLVLSPSNNYPFGTRAPENLDETIREQQAAVEDITPVCNYRKREQLAVLGGLFMRRFESKGALEDLDEAIKNQQAAVDLTPTDGSEKPERLKELGKLLIRRFERKGELADLDGAIKNQQTAVRVGNYAKLECLSVLSGLFMRRFEYQGMPDDLNRAIQYKQAAVDLTPGDFGRPESLEVLGRLLMRRFERQDGLDDLEEMIKNQQVMVDLTPVGDSDRPERLSMLSGLLMRRFGRKRRPEDLEGAIKHQQAAAVLTPASNPSWPGYLRCLESFIDCRSQMAGDRNSEMGSSLRASVTAPTTLGSAKIVYKIVKDRLLEDLQQLSTCIKKSKRRELFTIISRMENAMLCLKLQDGDELCHDIFKTSTRLGAYCQALRNRAGDETNRRVLEDLCKEFLRIEREFSAAHDRISSKYEQLYRQWKAERHVISKFLSKVDSSKSQSDNLEARALLKQVDAGFEKMVTMLKNEANDLKNLSEALACHPRLVHRSPDPPVISSDSAQVPPQRPDSPSTPSGLSKQADDSVEALSRLSALVEKSRYTEARMIISEKSSKATQRLKKLHTSSEDYDHESHSLSCLRTRHKNDNSRDVYRQQKALCNQLSNLVGGMQGMLKAIVKGFNGCKASIQGLVFRPLGDLLCDLEPYLPRAGLEISRKGLHPDLILYDAAFQAIADTIPVHSKLLKDSLAVLDKLRGV